MYLPTRPVASSMDDNAFKKLTDVLRSGADIETASAFAGLPLSHVVDLVAQGQAEQERLDAGLPADPDKVQALKLWQDTYRARAEAVVRAIAQIQKAANQGDWKAAAWWLERAMPDTYQPKAKKEIMPTITYTCANGHRVTVTRRQDSDVSPVCGICSEPMDRTS